MIRDKRSNCMYFESHDVVKEQSRLGKLVFVELLAGRLSAKRPPKLRRRMTAKHGAWRIYSGPVPS
jgi:hypothetical protein